MLGRRGATLLRKDWGHVGGGQVLCEKSKTSRHETSNRKAERELASIGGRVKPLVYMIVLYLAKQRVVKS